MSFLHYVRYVTVRNCSVPEQLRAKIQLKSPAAMGFLLALPRFLTVSAAGAQTY